MKKVFLSLPMSGHTDEWIRDQIELMKHALKDDEIAVDNYIEKPEGSERLYCLGEAIKKLGECDAIMLHPRWIDANGCVIEYYVARQYGLEIIDLR